MVISVRFAIAKLEFDVFSIALDEFDPVYGDAEGLGKYLDHKVLMCLYCLTL